MEPYAGRGKGGPPRYLPLCCSILRGPHPPLNLNPRCAPKAHTFVMQFRKGKRRRRQTLFAIYKSGYMSVLYALTNLQYSLSIFRYPRTPNAKRRRNGSHTCKLRFLSIMEPHMSQWARKREEERAMNFVAFAALSSLVLCYFRSLEIPQIPTLLMEKGEKYHVKCLQRRVIYSVAFLATHLHTLTLSAA